MRVYKVACCILHLTGALKGFTDIGDINSHLQKYEDDDICTTPLADSMLVLMVRGLLSRLEFPYAQFPCTALTGDQLFVPFWEAVCRLERCGFKVMGVTADGLSVNRNFFKLHEDDTTKSDMPLHKTTNPYTSEERYLYFFRSTPFN